MYICLLTNKINILLRWLICQSIRNILFNRSREQNWFLLYYCHIRLITLCIQIPQILVPIHHITIHRIIEPLHELNNRRLSATRAANQRHSLVLLDMDRSLLDHSDLLLGGIRELNVLQPDRSVGLRGGRYFITANDLDLRVVKVDGGYPDHGTLELEDVRDDRGHHDEVDQETKHVRVERIDLTDGEVVVEVKIGGHPDEGVHGTEHHTGHHKLVESIVYTDCFLDIENVLKFTHVNGCLIILRAKSLDCSDVAETFLSMFAGLGCKIGNFLGQFPELSAHALCIKHYWRQNGKHEKCHLPTNGEYDKNHAQVVQDCFEHQSYL